MVKPDRRVEMLAKIFRHLSEEYIREQVQEVDRELERIAEDRRMAWMKA